MAQILLTIPNDKITEVVEALTPDYQDIINGEPNPLTRPQAAKQRLIEFIKEAVVDKRARASRPDGADLNIS